MAEENLGRHRRMWRDLIALTVNVHVVLLEENTARNPEFDYDRLELADVDNS